MNIAPMGKFFMKGSFQISFIFCIFVTKPLFLMKVYQERWFLLCHCSVCCTFDLPENNFHCDYYELLVNGKIDLSYRKMSGFTTNNFNEINQRIIECYDRI